MALGSIGHPKKVEGHEAMLVLSPEHYRIFRDAGWDRVRILAEFDDVLRKPGSEIVRGAGGVEEGVVPEQADDMLSKFWPGGLHIVRAGRSEEQTSELQSLMRISYAVFCLKKNTYTHTTKQ